MTSLLAACGGGGLPDQPSGDGGHYKPLRPYQIKGRWYEPRYDPRYREVGVASWYGDPFHGRLTANGERYDKRLLSAAHTTLPLPSIARVTNLENGRSIEVRVNDRGPFAGNRIIDMSEAAAEALGFKRAGLARVEVEFLALANARGTPPTPTVRARAKPAPERARPAPQTASMSVPCEGYYVQVGAFATAEQARAAARQLQTVFSQTIRGQPVQASGITRVRLGPFGGVDEAHRALATVSRQGYGEAFMMRLSSPAGACSPRTA